MKDVSLFITIIQRAHAEEFLKFYARHGVGVVYSTPCAGTARSKTLDILGIEKTEKTMIFSVLTGDQRRSVIGALTSEMQIDLPDRGIGIAVPLSCIGGKTALSFLTGATEVTSEREEKQAMNPFELIIAITDKDATETVMDAARAAGAGGGTVIRAKGTYAAGQAKFLGVSLADEKELIFIVTHEEQKKDIMRAIMGSREPHPLVFSMPVSDTAGFRLYDVKKEEDTTVIDAVRPEN